MEGRDGAAVRFNQETPKLQCLFAYSGNCSSLLPTLCERHRDSAPAALIAPRWPVRTRVSTRFVDDPGHSPIVCRSVRHSTSGDTGLFIGSSNR